MTTTDKTSRNLQTINAHEAYLKGVDYGQDFNKGLLEESNLAAVYADWKYDDYFMNGFLEITGIWLPDRISEEIKAEREMEVRMDQFRRQEAETAMGWTL